MNVKQFLNNAVCHTRIKASAVWLQNLIPCRGKRLMCECSRGWDNENVTVRTQFLLLSSTRCLLHCVQFLCKKNIVTGFQLFFDSFFLNVFPVSFTFSPLFCTLFQFICSNWHALRPPTRAVTHLTASSSTSTSSLNQSTATAPPLQTEERVRWHSRLLACCSVS